MEIEEEPQLNQIQKEEAAELLKKYKSYQEKAEEQVKDEPETWNGEEYESWEDLESKMYHRFQKRIERSPDQCLR
jgi:hypothetical protein